MKSRRIRRHELSLRVSGPIVVDGAAQTLVEIGLRPEAELPFGAIDIEAAARLAVRLRRVPDDAAAEPGEGSDLFGQIADGDLAPASQIDRFRLIVPV